MSEVKVDRREFPPVIATPVAKFVYRGSITLFIGPMFSGKTSAMKEKVRTEAYAGKPAVVIKWKADTRYSGDGEVAVGTHSREPLRSSPGTEYCASIRVVETSSLLKDVQIDPSEIVVGVDEGQAYPDLLEMCEKWAGENKTVVVSALDGDFKRAPFEEVCRLVPKAENVVKLHAVCMRCRSSPASFTARTVHVADRILIGAADKYKAACRSCWSLPSDV